MSVHIRIENCSPGEVIDLTLALTSRGRGSLVAAVDPASPSVAVARTRTELAGLLKPSEMPLPARREDGSLGAEVWARLLPWAASEAGAVGAFVLDQSGLIVAETPALPFERLDEIVAHVCVLVHEAVAIESVGHKVGATSLELGSWWLTALQVPLNDGGWLVLVLVGEDVPKRESRKEIVEEVRLFVNGA